MPTYRDEGVVLRTIRLGEADRIVTLLTRNHGKVRAVAKGVRKTKSRMGGRVEPLTHAALMCWKGRELDVVTQAEVIDSFRTIRESLALLTPALTVLEIVDQLALADMESEALFAMVIGALRTLERTGSPLVLGAFCFKLLALEGLSPALDRCARCGQPEPLVAFDPDEGGFLCRGCRRGQAVSEEVVALARGVMSGQLGRLVEEDPHGAVDELERLGIGAIEHHLNRRLRSSHQLLDGDRLGA